MSLPGLSTDFSAAMSSQPTRRFKVPPELPILALDVRQIDANTYFINMGEAVAAFMAANAPHHIVEYDWDKVRTKMLGALVTRHAFVDPAHEQSNPRHDFADRLVLTDVGEREHRLKQNNSVVYQVLLACRGNGNCKRKCCDGLGACTDLCSRPATMRHYACAAKISITCTLADVYNQRVQLRFLGRHVPPNVTRVPPCPRELRPDPHVLRSLGKKALSKSASHAVREYATELNKSKVCAPSARFTPFTGSTSSSAPLVESGRYFVTPVQVRRIATSARRSHRGDATLSAYEKLNRAVMEVFVPKRCVLDFEPLGEGRGHVVLSTDWHLSLAATYARDVVGTDAKHDTTVGRECFWSSLRFPTPRGWYPACVWLSPTETADSMRCAFRAYYLNVPCDVAGCDHALVAECTNTGGFRRRRKCVAQGWGSQQAPPWASPMVSHDKHLPTFNAVHETGFSGSFLDPYHGFESFSRYLKQLRIYGSAAAAASWAFRLYRRSCSDEQADEMRNAFVHFVLDVVDELWPLKKAEALVLYFDRRWHVPDAVRTAWIDGAAITLMLRLRSQNTPFYPLTTCSNEGSHRWWDAHIMRGVMCNDLVTVGCLTVGWAADGDKLHGFLDDAKSRWIAGKQPRPSLDAALSEARACLMLLRYGTKLLIVEPRPSAPSAPPPSPSQPASSSGSSPPSSQLPSPQPRRPSSNPMPPPSPPPPSSSPPSYPSHAFSPPPSLPSPAPSSRNFVWVRKFAGDDACLRRHANADGYVPHLHKSLDQMRRQLSHAGPHSFQKPDAYAVDLATGRCECLESTYHGVTSSRGECKHVRYARAALRLIAQNSLHVLAAALSTLRLLVRRREEHKNIKFRCQPLYEASGASQDAKRLLDALAEHASVPPTGRADGGLAHPLDANDGLKEGAHTIKKCIFTTTVDLDDLGVGFAERIEDGEDGLSWVSVSEYRMRKDGKIGPAMFSGDKLHAGDAVIHVCGMSDVRVDELGNLCLDGASIPLIIEFTRQPLQAHDDESEAGGTRGGRPAKRHAKHNAGGGAPRAKSARKPQATRPCQMQQQETPTGSADANVSSADTVDSLRKLLLSQEHLTATRELTVEEGSMLTYIP